MGGGEGAVRGLMTAAVMMILLVNLHLHFMQSFQALAEQQKSKHRQRNAVSQTAINKEAGPAFGKRRD